MKYRLETQAKPTHFHGIFNFDTVTNHSDARPVLFGKLGIVVGIKSWSLLKNKTLSTKLVPDKAQAFAQLWR